MNLVEALDKVKDELPAGAYEYLISSDTPKKCIVDILETKYNKALDWVYSVI